MEEGGFEMLKNYTTKINFNQSLIEIEKLLISIGAKKIIKEYDEQGIPKAVIFDFELEERRIPVRLPARIDRIPEALRRHFNNNKDSGAKYRLKQAMQSPQNVGWRILKDWLEANIAIMQLDQINMMEALLPFSVMTNGQTLYELLESHNFSFKSMAQNILEDKRTKED
jgi:hypothetical protein